MVLYSRESWKALMYQGFDMTVNAQQNSCIIRSASISAAQLAIFFHSENNHAMLVSRTSQGR